MIETNNGQLKKHLPDPLFTFTGRKYLHKNQIDGIEAIIKPLMFIKKFSNVNLKCRMQYYHKHKSQPNDVWNKVIWQHQDIYVDFPLFSIRPIKSSFEQIDDKYLHTTMQSFISLLLSHYSLLICSEKESLQLRFSISTSFAMYT